MPGVSNLADIFTKEDKDVAHYESIRDQMVMPRESFGKPKISINNSTLWGVLERRLSDRNYEKLTNTIKSEPKSSDKELTYLTNMTNSKSKPSNTNHYIDDALDDSKSPAPTHYFNDGYSDTKTIAVACE